jgi:hypothetical protein
LCTVVAKSVLYKWSQEMNMKPEIVSKAASVVALASLIIGSAVSDPWLLAAGATMVSVFAALALAPAYRTFEETI